MPRPISTALIAWMLITAGGQPGVELAVPLGVAPQADRAAGDDRLDDAAERVARLLGGVDRRDDRRVGLGVERVDRAGVADRRVERRAGRGDPAQLADVAEDVDPELARAGASPAPPTATRRAVSRALARSRTWRMPVW